MRNMVLVVVLSVLCSSCVAGAVLGGLAGGTYVAGCMQRNWWPCDDEKPAQSVPPSSEEPK